MLAKSNLSSIEKLISQALTDMDTSHEQFITILKEKDRYEMMKFFLAQYKRKKVLRILHH